MRFRNIALAVAVAALCLCNAACKRAEESTATPQAEAVQTENTAQVEAEQTETTAQAEPVQSETTTPTYQPGSGGPLFDSGKVNAQVPGIINQLNEFNTTPQPGTTPSVSPNCYPSSGGETPAERDLRRQREEAERFKQMQREDEAAKEASRARQRAFTPEPTRYGLPSGD